jgi:hypothetical protein
MSRPHKHNKRRFNTYRTLDRIEDARPVVVLPAVGEGFGMLQIDAVTRFYRDEHQNLRKALGGPLDASSKLTEAEEKGIALAFERRFGKKPIPVEDLIGGRHG